ncbi:MAG: hypothetical protein H6658_21330 [Ardenticatenaceae bacterium]|nr:hypothetical protein [Ardenticatenaceae bacterium]
MDPSPRLDHDTKNIPGTPEIAATIFRKIKNCHFFLADLTFVGTTNNEENPKPIPNPNVLIELGFAASSIGWGRIICVMNTDYGAPEQQIFNIRHHRFPIRYSLEGKDRGQVRDKLAEQLKHAIESLIWYEHENSKETIAKLDIHCLIFLQQYAETNHINPPPTNKIIIGAPVGQLDTAGFSRAVSRLLELGLVKTVVALNGMFYEWTYLGLLILRHLGLRKIEG